MSVGHNEIVLVGRPPEEGPFRRVGDVQLVTPVYGVDGECREVLINKAARIEEVVGELRQSGYPRTKGVMGMDFDDGINKQRFKILRTSLDEVCDLVPIGNLGIKAARKVQVLETNNQGGEAVINLRPGLTDRVLVRTLGRILRREIEGISQDKECFKDGQPSRFLVTAEGEVAVMIRLG